jgi:heptosyltransferase-2
MRGGALGDFILTLPVLAALRRKYPSHQIEILGYPAIASLAVAGGLADAVSAIESPRLTGIFVRNGTVDPPVAEWFSGFDFIVSYLSDPERIFQSNIARHTSVPFVAGPHRPDETRAVHATEQLLEPLQSLGIVDADSQPRLRLPSAGPKSRGIAAHVGSGSAKKNWPEADWLELLEKVPCKILLIGGEAEGDRCARLATPLPPGQVEVAQSLPLVELAGRMQTCSGFIGHDSGITHLAAALGLPGVVLWGPSNLTVWRPQSDQMKIVQGLDTPVETVFRELQTFL